MNSFKEINNVEIVNIEGRNPIQVRTWRHIGMKEFNAVATFVDNNEYTGAWHSVSEEEAKRVAIDNLLEQEMIWESL